MQDRIVETAPLEARTGERDSVPEPVRKKIRFTCGTVVANSRSTSSSSSSSCSSDSSSSPTSIATSMQVGESNQLKKKVTHGADMELEGLVMECERDSTIL